MATFARKHAGPGEADGEHTPVSPGVAGMAAVGDVDLDFIRGMSDHRFKHINPAVVKRLNARLLLFPLYRQFWMQKLGAFVWLAVAAAYVLQVVVTLRWLLFYDDGEATGFEVLHPCAAFVLFSALYSRVNAMGFPELLEDATTPDDMSTDSSDSETDPESSSDEEEGEEEDPGKSPRSAGAGLTSAPTGSFHGSFPPGRSPNAPMLSPGHAVPTNPSSFERVTFTSSDDDDDDDVLAYQSTRTLQQTFGSRRSMVSSSSHHRSPSARGPQHAVPRTAGGVRRHGSRARMSTAAPTVPTAAHLSSAAQQDADVRHRSARRRRCAARDGRSGAEDVQPVNAASDPLAVAAAPTAPPAVGTSATATAAAPPAAPSTRMASPSHRPPVVPPPFHASGFSSSTDSLLTPTITARAELEPAPLLPWGWRKSSSASELRAELESAIEQVHHFTGGEPSTATGSTVTAASVATSATGDALSDGGGSQVGAELPSGPLSADAATGGCGAPSSTAPTTAASSPTSLSRRSPASGPSAATATESDLPRLRLRPSELEPSPSVSPYRRQHAGYRALGSYIVNAKVWDDESASVVKHPYTFARLSVCIVDKVIFATSKEVTRQVDIAPLCALAFAVVPSMFRIMHSTRSLEERFALLAEWLASDRPLAQLPQHASTLSSWLLCWDKVTILSCAITTFLVVAAFATLLSSAEEAYRSRYLSAKYFAALTSARRAHRFKLPHFRLHKISHIKMWLSLRSFLRKRGSRRSVDVVVSACFQMAVALVVLMMVLQVKTARVPGIPTRGTLDFTLRKVYWIVLTWCMLVAWYLLRYMTLGSAINRKYHNSSVLLTEQINLVRVCLCGCVGSCAKGGCAWGPCVCVYVCVVVLRVTCGGYWVRHSTSAWFVRHTRRPSWPLPTTC